MPSTFHSLVLISEAKLNISHFTKVVYEWTFLWNFIGGRGHTVGVCFVRSGIDAKNTKNGFV